MMIFGFNSDVKQANVVYHVQSEARHSDLLLQTLIFVKGQCVGKHAYSYAEMTLQPGFSESAMHEVLKAQHKSVIDAIEHGHVESILGAGGEVEDVGGGGLTLKWTNPAEEARGDRLIMRFQVLDSGAPVSGSEVAVRLCPPAEATVLARSLTDSSGATVLVVPVAGAAEAAVMARATHGYKSATRKFRFKK